MKWAKLSLVALIILIGCKEDFTKTAVPPSAPYKGGELTRELMLDELGIEGQATDAITDCSSFDATNGGIFYDDSEGKWKKCQDNSLTDLDTTGLSGTSYIHLKYTSTIADWFDPTETGSIAYHLSHGIKHIFVGAGTFPYSDTLNIDTSGITIVGEGMGVTTFSKTGGNGLKGILIDHATTQVENITLKGFTIDGNRANFAHPRNYSHGIDVKYAKNIHIEAVGVVEAGDDTNTHTTGGSGISVNHEASRVSIVACYLDDNEDRGIQLGGVDIEVRDNFVDSSYDRSCSTNLTDDTGTNRNASRVLISNNIFEDASNGSATGVYGDSKNIIISNNILRNCSAGGLRLRAIDTSSRKNIVFSGNQVIDCSYGVVTFDIMPIYSGTSTGGNTNQNIKDTSASWPASLRFSNCITITGGTGVGQTRRITGGVDTTLFINNDSVWSIIPDSSSTYSIFPVYPLGIDIINNTIENSSSRAIFTDGLPLNIRNNTFSFCDAAFIEALNTSIVVSGNNFVGLNKVPIKLSYVFDAFINGNNAVNAGDPAVYHFVQSEASRGTVISNNIITKFDDIANLKSMETGSYKTEYTKLFNNTLLYGDFSINFTDEENTIVESNRVYPATSSYQNDPDVSAVFINNIGFGP